MSYIKYLNNLGGSKFYVVKKYGNGDPVAAPTRSNLQPREWIRNWYANRKLSDSNANAILDSIRPELLKSIDTLPMYDLRDNEFMNPNPNSVIQAAAHYRPEDHAISILDSYYHKDKGIEGVDNPDVKSVLVHEMGHAVDVPNAKEITKINKEPYLANITDDVMRFFKNSGTNPSFSKADFDNILLDFRHNNKLPLGKKISNEDLPKDISELDKILEYTPDIFFTSYLGKNGKNGVDTSRQLVLDLLNGDIKVPEEDFINSDPKVLEEFMYYTDPTEVSSRLMQLRYDMGLKPDEVVSPNVINDYIGKTEKTKKGLPSYILDLINVMKEDDIGIGLSDMLNKFVSNEPKKNSKFSQYLSTIKNA